MRRTQVGVGWSGFTNAAGLLSSSSFNKECHGQSRESAGRARCHRVAGCGVFLWLFRPLEEQAALKAPRGNAASAHGDPGSIAANGNPGASGTSPSTDDFGSNMTFEQIKREAEHGSAKAQRQLSEIYAFCAPYSLGPEKWLAGLDNLATLAPASVNGITSVKKRLATRCKEVDFGQPIPAEAYRLWAEQAAKGGDVASKIKIRTWATQPLIAAKTRRIHIKEIIQQCGGRCWRHPT